VIIILIQLIIDRLEREYAVIEYQNTTFNFPRSLLPKGAKEGTVLRFNIDLDEKETETRRKNIQEQLDNLKKKDQGGDIQL
jgi:hypothetical protein